MNKNYFGFAVSGSMFKKETFKEGCQLNVSFPDAFSAKNILKDWQGEGSLAVCANPSHQSTIDALKAKEGIEVNIPETPVKVVFNSGDKLLLFQVDGLPRLTDRHEYTPEEISRANFTFQLWEVK